MDLGIAKVLDLNEKAKDIVCANLDFMKKVNIITAAGAIQFPDQKDQIDNLLRRVAGINNPDRQTVIHSTFEPIENGVRFSRIIAKGALERSIQDWNHGRFFREFSAHGCSSRGT